MTWEIRQGDALAELRKLEAESVQTVVTSPPYWGLRDYGVGDEGIGLEPTPEQYVSKLVEVFREVRRVLRSDGTVWLNLGDSYAGSWSGNSMRPDGGSQRTGGPGFQPLDDRVPSRAGVVPTGLKPKDLCGIPWRVAFALQADGWWLRSDIVWSKPNPMPESVKDRPTRSHEYLFLLTKSARYFYDAEAVREEGQNWSSGGPGTGIEPTFHYGAENGGNEGLSSLADRYKRGEVASGRNKRSVWNIATQPFPGAHFATFPEKLVEPCVLAGSSPKACGECGAPWEKLPLRRGMDQTRPQAQRAMRLATEAGLTPEHIAAIRAVGITDAGKAQVTQDGYGKNHPTQIALAHEAKEALGGYYREFLLERTIESALCSTCQHDDDSGSCLVLDPFAGSGTVGVVALRYDRSFLGIELNPDYWEMARHRIRDDAPLLNSHIEHEAA